MSVLTVFDDGGGPALYAGGWFNTAGSVSADNIAKWDGANWSALGPGMNGFVFELEVFDDGGGPALYAAGSFDTAIAKWNGESWSNLGSGVNNSVVALKVFDDGGGPALYVGGNFSVAGGGSAEGFAKWDGASWSALGMGINGGFALTEFDNGWGPALYAGGYFTTAGGHVSAYFAKWSCRLDTTRAITFTPSAAASIPMAAASSHHQIANRQSQLDAVSSIQTGNAIRVTLDSLHHVYPPYTGGPSVAFTIFEGEDRWVGPPTQYVESTASGIPFIAAQLQCTPHYQDWSTVGLLNVFGSAIVPSSSYRVEMLAGSCLGIEDTCTDVSSPLALITTRWGDVETPYNPPDLSVQPDLSDISALVNKFRSAPGAPIKARALLAGTDQFGNINIVQDLDFTHISACVDAFRGRPYPYAIQACP